MTADGGPPAESAPVVRLSSLVIRPPSAVSRLPSLIGVSNPMWEQIASNKRRSFFLITLMAVILVALGAVIGMMFGREEGAFVGIGVAVLIWVVLWLAAILGGRQILLGSARATEIGHNDAPRLFNVVEEMTIAAGLPKRPKVYIMDCDQPNAFAVGTPENSAVAVTSGLMMRLSRDELQGVIAHEIGHIKNHDTRFMTLAGVMVAAIVIIADVFLRTMFYTGAGTRRSSSRRGGGGQAQVILVLVAIVFAILAPILAQILYFACSRRREYLADASAARFTRYPEGLASALQKIAGSAAKMPNVNRATAPMYIINPLKGSSAHSIFSTHPATAERVRILRSMAGAAGFANYDNAFRKVTGKRVIGQQTLADADAPGFRAPSAEAEKGDLGKAREAVDILHTIGGFIFLQCACGLKIKVPPTYAEKEVHCPRCSRVNPMPAALMAAAGVAAAIRAGEEADPDAAKRTAAKPRTYRFVPGKWQSFRCDCGNTIQLSPNFRAGSTRCRRCHRMTKIIR